MNNKSVSDFVASTMNSILESAEHKTLFGVSGQYKFAQDANASKDECAVCHEHPCGCDSSKADDNDARKAKKCEACGELKSECTCDSSKADDNEARKKKEKKSEESSSSSSSDSSKADDQDMKSEAAFSVAIDSLLTASAALDAVGMEKTSALSLKLASLVVEAKKKNTKDKKEKKTNKDKKDSKSSSSSKSSKNDSKSSKK